MADVNDLRFAMQFAQLAGGRIVKLRSTTRRSKKLDRTDATDVDASLNGAFIRAVASRGDTATVKGKERSFKGSYRRIWIIDPLDGVGEYITDSIPDHKRTTCFAVALLVDGELSLSIVFNPFRNEMFTATDKTDAQLNGRRLTASSMKMERGKPYDFSHWKGAPFKLNRLPYVLGPPRGDYSAIYQACMVAAGRSCFAAFPGSTIHDIAPAALIARQAGARVTDLRGKELAWSDLRRGALYASRQSQQQALKIIASL